MKNLSFFLPSLSKEKIQQMDAQIEIFLSWNKKLNLSSIRTREGVVIKHVLDSLLILPFNWICEGNKVLDVGTGGGFPGLALAIAYPKTKFTLFDATRKKIEAVQSMAKELSISNVDFLIGRAEDLGREKTLREQFDVVTARSVAPFPTLLELCLPFVKINGLFIAYQGPDILPVWKQYQKIAETLSSHIEMVKETILPIEEAKRVFVIVKKISRLSNQYPRRTGIPEKKPLA